MFRELSLNISKDGMHSKRFTAPRIREQHLGGKILLPSTSQASMDCRASVIDELFNLSINMMEMFRCTSTVRRPF